jgi:hypothetical protein
MQSIQRNGMFSFTEMARNIVNDLNGQMSLENVDGSTAASDANTMTSKAFLRSSNTVDPATDQPWVIAVEFSDEEQWLDFYVCAPEQIIDANADFRIAIKNKTGTTEQRAGKLTYNSYHRQGSTTYRSASFEQWDMAESDTQANPLSYQLCVGDHGISLFIWVESYDSSGDKFAWFVVQRMVDTQGVPVVDGKAPLFCVFSNKGYSSSADSLNNPDPRSIMKFVVRESDVNSPTFPVTAIEDTADSTRIINAAQQVSLREGNNVVMIFPNGLNTQRHMYPHQLDMFAVISADVISQSTELPVDPFGEASPRIYRGMNADNTFNKGARILFWVSGGNS